MPLLAADPVTVLPDQREVLVLSRFQELKYEQIAQLLHTTAGAVKVRAHRALCQLKTIYLKLENGKTPQL